MREIMRMGRWKSDAVLLYLHVSLKKSNRDQIALAMSRRVSKVSMRELDRDVSESQVISDLYLHPSNFTYYICSTFIKICSTMKREEVRRRLRRRRSRRKNMVRRPYYYTRRRFASSKYRGDNEEVDARTINEKKKKKKEEEEEVEGIVGSLGWLPQRIEDERRQGRAIAPLYGESGRNSSAIQRSATCTQSASTQSH